MSASRFHLHLDWLLAVGVLLALETQLRSETSIAGPGEICLAAWIVAALAHESVWPSIRLTKVSIYVIVFWTVFAFAQCMGMIQTIASGALVDVSLVLHDVFADTLAATLCLLLTAGPLATQRLRHAQWKVTLIGGLSLAAQLANAAGLFAFGDIDPWYWDRLRGWSSNPNQLALLCLLVAFISLHQAETEKGLKRAFAIPCFAVAVVAGWLAKSNAYVIVLVVALGAFVAIKALRWLLAQERRRTTALPFSAAAASTLVYLVLILLPLAGNPADLVHDAGDVARNSRNELESPAVRFDLWKQALRRSMDSYMLGYGPGPHLDIPNIVLAGRRSGNEPANMQHPKDGTAPNFESHNTLMELLLQGGLLAVCDYLCILALAFWRAWRAGNDGLLTGLLAINGFGSFHVVFRHPFIWFIMSSALVAARTQKGDYYARQAAPGPFAPSPSPARTAPC